jgi:hypothetical protein
MTTDEIKALLRDCEQICRNEPSEMFWEVDERFAQFVRPVLPILVKALRRAIEDILSGHAHRWTKGMMTKDMGNGTHVVLRDPKARVEAWFEEE